MIRILLTDGHAPFREALRIGLAAVADAEVVGEAGTGPDLLAQLPAAAPDVVLLDLSLPGSDAFALLPALQAQYPQLRLPAHGELTNEQYVARAFDLGAHGYLLKSGRPTGLAHGLRTVAAGRPFRCSSIGLTLLNRLRPATAAPASGNEARSAMGLSKREMQVLALVAEGLTNAEIAERLFTSKRTVETHRQNLMKKTRTRNTAALIRLAARQGWLPV